MVAWMAEAVVAELVLAEELRDMTVVFAAGEDID